MSYMCICAAGTNSATLHYPNNDKIIRDGDFALLDMGAELHCYCSDITSKQLRACCLRVCRSSV